MHWNNWNTESVVFSSSVWLPIDLDKRILMKVNFVEIQKIIIYLCSDYTGFVISVHDSYIPLFELQRLVNVCDNTIYINVTWQHVSFNIESDVSFEYNIKPLYFWFWSSMFFFSTFDHVFLFFLAGLSSSTCQCLSSYYGKCGSCGNIILTRWIR